MEKISRVFEQGPALIGYLTAGDGGEEFSVEAALALIAGGVDILEIGVPFSDPVADGPVIQRAVYRSLRCGTTPDKVLSIASRIRQHSDVPLLLFSYYNPLLQMGDICYQAAQSAGFNGCLVVDLPLEECETHRRSCMDARLANVMLLSPSTPRRRIEMIDAASSGFLYYSCRKGTTGVRRGLPEDYSNKMAEIRDCASLPVVAGFGIGDRASAAEALKHADGVVVGSAFIRMIEEGGGPEELRRLARSIKTGQS